MTPDKRTGTAVDACCPRSRTGERTLGFVPALANAQGFSAELSSELFDDLDEFVASVSVHAGVVEKLFGVLD
jgi:hypothetical protein